MGFSTHPPALVLEFQERGSLYHNLHEVSIQHGPYIELKFAYIQCITSLQTENPLSWDGRGKVLHDTCRGLVYLHSATPQLVHQDIKS